MKQKVFETLVNIILENAKEILVKKGEEYSEPEGDRLVQFKIGAKLRNCTPERKCLDWMDKHWTSIVDMVDRLEKDETFAIQQWREKLHDIINYCILMEALLEDRYYTGYIPSPSDTKTDKSFEDTV